VTSWAYCPCAVSLQTVLLCKLITAIPVALFLHYFIFPFSSVRPTTNTKATGYDLVMIYSKCRLLSCCNPLTHAIPSSGAGSILKVGGSSCSALHVPPLFCCAPNKGGTCPVPLSLSMSDPLSGLELFTVI
jgi:hypothetical protein